MSSDIAHRPMKRSTDPGTGLYIYISLLTNCNCKSRRNGTALANQAAGTLPRRFRPVLYVSSPACGSGRLKLYGPSLTEVCTGQPGAIGCVGPCALCLGSFVSILLHFHSQYQMQSRILSQLFSDFHTKINDFGNIAPSVPVPKGQRYRDRYRYWHRYRWCRYRNRNRKRAGKR